MLSRFKQPFGSHGGARLLPVQQSPCPQLDGYCHRIWWIMRPAPANAYRAGFPFIRPSREAVSSGRSPSALSFTEPSLPFREPLLAPGALNRLSRGPAAEENRGLPPLSIVGSFCRLPELSSAGGSVAPDACPLALAAGRRSLVGMHADEQSDSRRATTPDGRASVGTAALWPSCDVPARLCHVGASD